MSTPGTSSDKSRQRRSPRLAKSVAVQIAGKDADGKVFVESTSTENLSHYGACVLTRSVFSIGAPIAIRRQGAKPARARVVSVKPGPQTGISRVGVEFVGDEGYWECEFPASWNEPVSTAPQTLSEPDLQKLEVVAQRIRALDASLESVARKAETIRAQAENTLHEAGAQMEAAKRENAAALASLIESLVGKRNALEAEIAGQVQASAAAAREQAETATASLRQQAAALDEKASSFAQQLEAALAAAQEKWQQLLAQQDSKAAESILRIDGQLERHRAAIAELDMLAESWRKQTAAIHASLHRETDAQVQSARGEMRTAATSVVREFRQHLPNLQEELSPFFSTLAADQKAAAGQLAAQSLDAMRASLAELEQSFKSSLRDPSRQALEPVPGRARGETPADQGRGRCGRRGTGGPRGTRPQRDSRTGGLLGAGRRACRRRTGRPVHPGGESRGPGGRPAHRRVE